MVDSVQSFLQGRWVSGRDGQALRDAARGRVIAQTVIGEVDPASVLAYARGQGRDGLLAVGFPERAAMLRTLARYLADHKEALYRLSLHTGATRADALIDIDGGIGTLAAYASLGAAELPAGNLWPEGPVVPLSRQGGFMGTHVLTPRAGVAVQINAFNFPVWGMLEKLAPAVLAGMPSLVKPATQTCYLAAACVRLIVDSGLLPEGALQLLIGPVDDLLGHLRSQDQLAFTGSAGTAAALRAHPALLAAGVPINVEADSLNAAVLSDDIGPDHPMFDRFITEVVREMTVKAGQKCTAIRRILVPRASLDALGERLAARLGQVSLGDPARDDVDMGPLVSAQQARDVRAVVARLCGSGEIIGATGGQPALRGDDLDPSAFVAPTLLLAREVDPHAPVHALEAFGPVASLLPYDDPDQAVALVNAGQGSLVTTVALVRPDRVARWVQGLAPWHGRLHLLDASAADQSTGHGSPLPTLKHGGPGRAGAGEELGGLRAVVHHLQRTALQGSPQMLMAATGEYVRGAPVTEQSVHPFRRHFEDLQVGDSLLTHRRTVTEADIVNFGCLSGDFFYMHFDELAARESPFGKRIAHGYFVLSAAAGLFVSPSPGPVLANYGLDTLRFVKPVGIGDTIQARLTCKRKAPRPRKPGDKQGQGVVAWDVQVTNQESQVVASYDILTLVLMRD